MMQTEYAQRWAAAQEVARYHRDQESAEKTKLAAAGRIKVTNLPPRFTVKDVMRGYGACHERARGMIRRWKDAGDIELVTKAQGGHACAVYRVAK